MNEAQLRRVEAGDLEFLRSMLAEAVCWREGHPHLASYEMLLEPALAKYVLDWGREGDSGVVAISESGERVGAAWYRLFAESDPGYGFVSPVIPELAVAIVPKWRGRGVGRAVMQGLIGLAEEEDRRGLSLSVEEDNGRAIHMYQSLGFRRVSKVDNAWTMLILLGPVASDRC